MPLKIALTPTYRVKVTVDLPAENGGFEQSEFMAEFKRCDSDEIDELRKLPGKEVVPKVLKGWSGLLDAADQEVPFNETNYKTVMAIPQAAAGLAHHFWTSIFKAREKN
jgi:hypothetical protein